MRKNDEEKSEPIVSRPRYLTTSDGLLGHPSSPFAAGPFDLSGFQELKIEVTETEEEATWEDLGPPPPDGETPGSDHPDPPATGNSEA